MGCKPLTELIDATIAAGQVQLPVCPDVARQAATVLGQGRRDAAPLARLISLDPVLACSLFRAANASFYQGLPKVLTIDEAMTRIGLERTGEVIEAACRVGMHSPPGQHLARRLPALWQHAFGCALGARWLAGRCGYQALADQAHLAGLLHDIGKLSLLATLEQISTGAGNETELADQLVDELLDQLHVELGLRLLDDWQLPDAFAAAIGRHHETGLDPQELVVALVRLANQGCRKTGLGTAADPQLVLPTTAEAQFLGIDEISLAEYEIMLEDRFQLLPAARSEIV